MRVVHHDTLHVKFLGRDEVVRVVAEEDEDLGEVLFCEDLFVASEISVSRRPHAMVVEVLSVHGLDLEAEILFVVKQAEFVDVSRFDSVLVAFHVTALEPEIISAIRSLMFVS